MVMSVAVVQEASGLEPDANRARLAELTPDGVDLVVFPEAFARDFGEAGSDVSHVAEEVDGPFASARGAGRRRAPDHHRGRDVRDQRRTPRGRSTRWWCAAARRAEYRKIHLYDSFGYRESDRLSAGDVEPRLVEVGGLVVGLMTCYDLRFPELARLLVAEGAEVLVVPAAWVAGPRKVDHWRTLVRARAVENTVFVVAAGPARAALHRPLDGRGPARGRARRGR